MNTEIILVVDTSGSMTDIALEASQGFSNFIREQADLPGAAHVSLTTFSTIVEHHYSGCDIRHVPPFVLHANGWTAMYDGIGLAMQREDARISREQWADKVIVAILTDGHENRSRIFNQVAIRGMITTAKARGWSFIFLGANIDAHKAGSSLGIDAEHTYQFVATGEGTRRGFADISTSTRSLRGTSL